MSARLRGHRGVTLVELIVTIVLGGIVSLLAVQFIQPVRAYIDTSRRAALADAADGALRRMGRDLRLALPNSVRVTDSGGVTYIEFLLVRTGGRYRAEPEAATTTGCTNGSGTDPAEDTLSFSTADSCFKTLGSIPNLPASNTDFVVVFNLAPGSPAADAYAFPGTGGNKSQLSSITNAGAGVDRVNFGSHAYSYASPGSRFFIVEGPVTYACDPVGGTLKRHAGYTISSTQPTPPAGGGALMASGVTGCSAFYQANVAAQSAGMVTLQLQLSTQDSAGDTETVTLYHVVHVSNVP
jgi:MSHA biogenesis protein MshO